MLATLAFNVLLGFCLLQGIVGQEYCIDMRNERVEGDEWFHPDPNEPCLKCLCDPVKFALIGRFDSSEFVCMMVQCEQPSCSDYERLDGECCGYRCPNENSDVPQNSSLPSQEHPTRGEPSLAPRPSEPRAGNQDRHRTTGVRALSLLASPCCQMGRDWYVESREQCGLNEDIVRGVEPQEKYMCASIADVCCVQERQEVQCQRGKQHAQTQDRCDTNSLNTEENTAARFCCDCCSLGLRAARAGESCGVMADVLDESCRQVFTQCCYDHPAASQTTTFAPITAPRVSGLCSQFQGQLCAHICTETTYSYRCSCRDGFELAGDGRTCRQKRLEDRCNTNNPCQQLCEDSGLGIVCNCFDGFVLAEDGRTCEDINECIIGTHTCSEAQTCRNMEGTFTCEGPSEPPQRDPATDPDVCEMGLAYNSLTGICEDIDECIINPDVCGLDLVCINEQGSYRCDVEPITDYGGFPETGLDCGTGFQYNAETYRCEDIDECDLGVHRCAGPLSPCKNTRGSYVCTGDMCDPGFRYNERSQACQDVNECALNIDICMAGQRCVNNEGSYQCVRTIGCGTGYTLDQATQNCVDIDECILNTDDCGPGYECRNIPGSYRCQARTCPRGYRLNTSSGTCDPVNCARGMRADQGGNCVDINECQDRSNPCLPNQECRNTMGSYTCRNLLSCGSGFELNDVGNRCEDIDECVRNTHDCHGALMQCVNRPGTYSCTCPDGYQINHSQRTCDDDDECIVSKYGRQVCGYNALCENIAGSYRCICNEGFRKEGNHCVDADECSQAGMCEHTCRNIQGSFLCSCYSGYKLAEDQRTCQDVDECQQYSRTPRCLGTCENTLGSYRCTCPSGYRMLGDGRTCRDIDECLERTANCYGDHQQCINVYGSFKCEMVVCPKGFVTAPSLSRNQNAIRCQRQTFVCPQGDTECLYAPLSLSYNFITFPTKIVTPADLFTMRGPRSAYRRLEFELLLISAFDPITKEQRVERSDFKLVQVDSYEVVVRLLKQVQGPQDVELKLTMSLYSREHSDDGQEVFFGTAVAVIKVFVTKDIY